jgi:hypothetical protein
MSRVRPRNVRPRARRLAHPRPGGVWGGEGGSARADCGRLAAHAAVGQRPASRTAARPDGRTGLRRAGAVAAWQRQLAVLAALDDACSWGPVAAALGCLEEDARRLTDADLPSDPTDATARIGTGHGIYLTSTPGAGLAGLAIFVPPRAAVRLANGASMTADAIGRMRRGPSSLRQTDIDMARTL